MRNRTKRALFGAVSLVAVAGISCAFAVPANAEPTHPNPTSESQEVALVGVGSDTIQDLFTGLTQSVTDSSANQVFASYDATGTATITPRVLGSTFNRPNGSGPGLAALKSAVSGTAGVLNGTAAVTLRGSDVQFSRSSSYNNTTLASNGRYTQIPIAVDAVTYATSGTTTSHVPSGIAEGGTPTTAAGTIASPDPLTLSNIFDGNGYLSGVIGGTTYQFFSGLGASSNQTSWPKLDVFVPQSGSGTRNFWYTALTLGSNTALPPGVLDTYIPSGSSTPVTNEEHDGSAIQSDALGIEPFSIAQWTAQSHSSSINSVYGTSITDRRHGVLLNSVGSVAPTVGGAPGTGTLNTAFPISRPVFVDLEFAQLKINPLLEAVFVNDSNFAASSTIYDAGNPLDGSTNVITDFGFAKIPSGGFSTPVYGATVFKQGDAQDYRFN